MKITTREEAEELIKEPLSIMANMVIDWDAKTIRPKYGDGYVVGCEVRGCDGQIFNLPE